MSVDDVLDFLVMDTAARPRRWGASAAGLALAISLVLLGDPGCTGGARSSTARITSGSTTVDVTVTRKNGRLCVRGDEVVPDWEGRPPTARGWCAGPPDQENPVAYGTSGPTLYVGVALNDVEGFSVTLSSQTYAVTPTPLPKGTFDGMKAWFLMVEEPAIPIGARPSDVHDIRRS